MSGLGERKCEECQSSVSEKPTHDHLLICHTCRENYCIEHQMDRRNLYHPLYCQPGEW